MIRSRSRMGLEEKGGGYRRRSTIWGTIWSTVTIQGHSREYGLRFKNTIRGMRSKYVQGKDLEQEEQGYHFGGGGGGLCGSNLVRN